MKCIASSPASARIGRASLLAAAALLLAAGIAGAQAPAPDSSAGSGARALPDSTPAAPAENASRVAPEAAPPAATPVPTPVVRAAAPPPRPIPGRRAAGSGIKQVAIRKVRLDRSPRNVVRAGPGDHFAIVAVRPKGEVYPVIAKSGDWNGVRLSEIETGWIHASLCTEFDDLSDLEFRPNPRLYSRTGSYTLGAYGGAYAFDRKSNSLVVGGRLGYYVFDRLQAEAGVAWTHIRRPPEIVESLFELSLEAEDFHMLFYHLNLNWEILPGRQMVPFVTAGVGSAIMEGETEPSLNFGAGTELFLSKRVAMRWEFRTYRFDSGSPDARLANHNIEFTLGTTYLF